MSGYIGKGRAVATANTESDTSPKLGGDIDFNGKKATNFTSTGVDDNATSNAITIDSSENVGIGTSSPDRPLHIARSSGATGVRIEGGTSQGGYIECWVDNTSKGVYFGNAKSILGGSYTAEEGAIYTEPGQDFIMYSGTGGENLRFLAAGGITFNGDTAAANALDDYEEGTWTPGVTFGGGGVGMGFSHRNGKYTKIGNCVFFEVHIYFNNKGSSSGTAVLTGFPYSASSVGGGVFITIGARGYINAGGDLVHLYNSGGTSMTFYQNQHDGGANSPMNNTQFYSNTEIDVTGHYFV
jgi:hypothetical protein